MNELKTKIENLLREAEKRETKYPQNSWRSDEAKGEIKAYRKVLTLIAGIEHKKLTAEFVEREFNDLCDVHGTTELKTGKELNLPHEMDEEIEFILGRPAFWLSPIAHLFQKSGVPIARKCEAEQAFVIFWMLGLYQKHGEMWRAAFDSEIKDLQRKVKINL